MSILAYIESFGGELKRASLELISYAKGLGELLGIPVIAIAFNEIDMASLSNLGFYGASKVLYVNNEKTKAFDRETYVAVLEEAVMSENAQVVVFSNTDRGKELAPKIAIRLKAGLVGNAVGLPAVEGSHLILKRIAFSGKAYSYVELTSEKKVITINPNTHSVIKTTATNAPIIPFESNVKKNTDKTVSRRTISITNKVSLQEAEIVVAGGRGLKGPENWWVVEDLAMALNAAIACSKPVSDAGWRPYEEHVGQTGLTISPSLYIAIGISGATQHLAGVSSSKTILVINKDPQAPFFKVAHYGIVGDAFEIVPKLIEALKAHKLHSYS